MKETLWVPCVAVPYCIDKRGLIYIYLNTDRIIILSFGEVSEWSKEVVLKTIELQGSVGSNPTFSVISVLYFEC